MKFRSEYFFVVMLNSAVASITFQLNVLLFFDLSPSRTTVEVYFQKAPYILYLTQHLLEYHARYFAKNSFEIVSGVFSEKA